MTDNKTSSIQAKLKATRIRWTIVIFIFILTAINYGARSTLGITGKAMSVDLQFDVANLGKIMAAFSTAYVLGQFPGGWLLDKFGSKKVYFCSVLLWSIFIFLCGFLGFFESVFGSIIPVAMVLMFFVGLSECPAFPANSRIAASWFPAKERGTAVSIYNSAQYFSTAIFAPILGLLVAHYTWKSAYFFMGGLGVLVSFVLLKVIYPPKKHPLVNQAEIDYIAEGGGLVDMDDGIKTSVVNTNVAAPKKPKKNYILQLASSRMMLGVCFAQYCINAITFFFISWFPVYLADSRGMDITAVGIAASIPALCGFVGGITGGVISDALLKKTSSLSIARKTPIVLGMLCSMAMIFCNYVDSIYMVIFFMSLSFFGKGIGALGWAVLADTAPKEISGQAGGFFNMCGNISSIVTPLVIAEIYRATGEFEWALIFVAAHALAAIISFLFVVGPIKRIELKKD